MEYGHKLGPLDRVYQDFTRTNTTITDIPYNLFYSYVADEPEEKWITACTSHFLRRNKRSLTTSLWCKCYPRWVCKTALSLEVTSPSCVDTTVAGELCVRQGTEKRLHKKCEKSNGLLNQWDTITMNCKSARKRHWIHVCCTELVDYRVPCF